MRYSSGLKFAQEIRNDQYQRKLVTGMNELKKHFDMANIEVSKMLKISSPNDREVLENLFSKIYNLIGEVHKSDSNLSFRK